MTEALTAQEIALRNHNYLGQEILYYLMFAKSEVYRISSQGQIENRSNAFLAGSRLLKEPSSAIKATADLWIAAHVLTVVKEGELEWLVLTDYGRQLYDDLFNGLD